MRADFLSRHHNHTLEWKLHPTVFLWISQSLFVPDIDVFASRLNFQTRCYLSWFPYPGTFEVDAFSLSWKDFRPYMFPPFSLIGRVLHKLKLDEVLDEIVIAPLWPTAP